MLNPSAPKRQMFKTPTESFAHRTLRRGACLVWTGAVKDTGYGAMWDGERVVRPHRWAYEAANGTIPAGVDIDHICGNRLCCEPAHLRLASRKQNMENLRHLRANNTSGVRGVSWTPRERKWRGRVKHHYREYSAGYYDTREEAEVATIALRLQLFTHSVEAPLEERSAA